MSFGKRSISGFPTPGSGPSNINNATNNKISLGLLKGKAITTSVPTIKFSAGAEEVVEVLSSCCEQEMTAPQGASPKHEQERSTSPVDSDTCQQILPTAGTPANDPWRFFSGIKGKITKSVEGKLIEYKNKSAITALSIPIASEEATVGRPPKNHQHKHGTNNSSSAGNSRSDSEDISESSLSKTHGGLSTTEGAEMTSTDEEDEEEEDGSQQLPFETNASVQKQVKQAAATSVSQLAPSPSCGGARYRLRTIGAGAASSGRSGSVVGGVTEDNTTVGESFLRALQRLAADGNEESHDPDVRTEQGVDVLEDLDVDGCSGSAMQPLDLNIDNMTIRSDDVIEVREVMGSEIRADLLKSLQEKQSMKQNNTDCRTIFNPKQFVDLRCLKSSFKRRNSNTSDKKEKYIIRAICATIVFLIAYFILSPLSVYFSGFILGVVSTLAAVRVYKKWLELKGSAQPISDVQPQPTSAKNIDTSSDAGTNNDGNCSVTVWMNEWPAIYTPETYTVAATQPVRLRLHRHLLRVSNTNARVPKRDMPAHQVDSDAAAAAAGTSGATCTFTRHRIYDLRGATVSLQPVGLTRVRWWSKKYPICVQLPGPGQLLTTQEAPNEDFITEAKQLPSTATEKAAVGHKQVVRKRRKWRQPNCTKDSTIQFSKLMFDDRLEKNDPVSSSMIDTLDLAMPVNVHSADSDETTEKDLKTVESTDDSNITRLYLFARTCRDKETWFHLLTSATSVPTTESMAADAIYHNYMDTILNVSRGRLDNSPVCEERTVPITEDDLGATSEHLVWLNAVLGRVWYSYATGGEGATMRLKDRIQRKLATIRLPAFIEELQLSELSICPPRMSQKVPVCIKWASRPVLNSRGVWVNLDLEYEGNVVLILQTKLNLMRLKDKGESDQGGRHPACGAEYRSAIFHSDVDDSAESSSDDESGGDSDYCRLPMDGPDSDGAGSSAAQSAVTAAAGSPNHKLIRMVDRIADSRLFRAATEYRYVQRALENVRNTDLCLRVEVRAISGRLCVNLPPPPSDRLWFGFRATPEPPRLQLRALPTVGDYHISLQHVTGWLEKRLVKEFHKVLVLPNMEDIVLPGLR